MKKFLSILLTVVLVLSTFTVGFAGAVDMKVNETTLKTKSKGIITLSAAPADEQYAWGDEIVFNVDVTNNTGTDYENVKVRAQANKAKFFYDGESNTVAVGSIKAGETQTIQISVKSSTPGILQRLIVLPIYYILDFFSPMAFKASDYDATALAKVGVFRYKFGFDVTDGSPKQAKPTEPDKPDVPVEPDKEVTISFNLNYAGAPATIPAQTVKAGEKAAPVTAPVRNGYTFMGWFTNPSCAEEYRFSFLFPIYDDLMVYAKWEEVSAPSTTYMVSFNLNYDGAPTIRPQTVAAGRTARAVADPTRNGYEFLGWFTDASCEEEFRFSFDMPVNSNLTLYAKWQATSGTDPFLDEPNPEVEIYSFDADTYDVLINTDTTVTFTAEVFSDNVLEENAVYVIDEENTVIGYMNDSGINGDEEAEDGIYTLETTLSSTTTKIVKFYVVADAQKSLAVSISFYKQITNEDYEMYETLLDKLDTAAAPYLDDNGFLIINQYDNAINALTSELEAQIANGIVDTYNVDGFTVSVTMKNGIPFEYCLSVEGVEAGVGTASIATYQSFRGQWDSQSLNDKSDAMTDGSARLIANSFDNYTFAHNNDLDNVSLDAMKSISDNDLVIINTHGGYDNTYGSSIALGQIQDSETTQHYIDDISAGRIYLATAAGKSVYVITGGFIDKYVGDMSGALIYLGACHSAEDMTDGIDNTYELAQAFINKGATAVVGTNGTVSASYDYGIGIDLFTRLTETKSNGSLYTLSEALEYAMRPERNGEQDGHGTSFDIYPQNNTAATNYRLQSSTGTINGIIKSATNNEGISNAVVRVYDKDSNGLIKTIRTNGSGVYAADLPTGEYYLKISAGQYKTAKVYITISEGRVTYVETFLLVRVTQSSGNASGRTINAITGERVQDVTIKVRRNWNNKTGAVLKTLSSDSDGLYEISYDAGYYTLECSKSGYVKTYKNIIISNNDTMEQNVSISPELQEGDYRVVLTWGINPHDLDSHLFGQNADGSSYHIYYMNQNGYNANGNLVANLDVDDVDSYGPETTTFTTDSTGTYEFYIDWYSGSGTWATSGGKVEVYSGERLLGTYYVPNVENRSGSWKVFTITNGRYESFNIIQEHDIY